MSIKPDTEVISTVEALNMLTDATNEDLFKLNGIICSRFGLTSATENEILYDNPLDSSVEKIFTQFHVELNLLGPRWRAQKNNSNSPPYGDPYGDVAVFGTLILILQKDLYNVIENGNGDFGTIVLKDTLSDYNYQTFYKGKGALCIYAKTFSIFGKQWTERINIVIRKQIELAPGDGIVLLVKVSDNWKDPTKTVYDSNFSLLHVNGIWTAKEKK